MVDAREDNRKEALGRALQQIEKAFGKGSIMFLKGEALRVEDGISTGSISLDLALGGAGIPRGRVIEIFGPESSGKTTLTLHVIAEARAGGGGVHRRRTCFRPELGQAHRHQPRRAADQPALLR